MNQLSWLIYLAEALDGLKFLCMWGIFIFFILTVVALFITLFHPFEEVREITSKTERTGYNSQVVYTYGSVIKTAEQARKDGTKVARGYFRLALFFFILSIIGANALPSKDTMYAIAASEVGESVLNSPTGSKAMAALNAWLDRQLAPPPPAARQSA